VDVIDPAVGLDLPLSEGVSLEGRLYEERKGLDGFREDQLSMWTG
jgi:hypothetical protein